MEDEIDPSVGYIITAKPGNKVTKGQPLATIHARSRSDLEVGATALREAIEIGDRGGEALPLVSHRITSRGVEALA